MRTSVTAVCGLLLAGADCCASFQPTSSSFRGTTIHETTTRPRLVASWQPQHENPHQEGPLYAFAEEISSEQTASRKSNQHRRSHHNNNENADLVVADTTTSSSQEQKDESLASSTLTTRRNRVLPSVKQYFRRQLLAWRNIFRSSSLRRRLATVALALVLALGSCFSPVWAVSGGRMGGGSFKSYSSGSPSRSRSAPSSSGRMGGGGGGSFSRGTPTLPRRPPGGRVYYSPLPRVTHNFHYGLGRPAGPIVIDRGFAGVQQRNPAIVTSSTGVKVRDIVVLTGTGALLAYGFRNNYRRNDYDGSDSVGPLGKGITVGSLTVALNVPNRKDPDNILNRLSRKSMTADTSSRKGVQDLLSSVALELLRHEQAVTSVSTESDNYPLVGQAERKFQLLSVQGRSKVDRLTGTCSSSSFGPLSFLIVTACYHCG